MRRTITIAIALSTLLLVSISLAQQISDKTQTNSAQSSSPIGIRGPVVGGDGVANYIPIWASRNYLLSSVIYQTGGNIGIGTTAPAAKLDVNGSINAATTYGIAGGTVLSIGSQPGDGNVFLGFFAGSSNVAGQGVGNSFSGYATGYNNTTGRYNTFSGYVAGISNTTGFDNTFTGYGAGYANTTGSLNTFYGLYAGYHNTTGDSNTFIGTYAGENNSGYENTFTGREAGHSNTSGYGNTFTGSVAGQLNTIGVYNTFTGQYAGSSNQTGSYNTFIGQAAGYGNTEGQSNVFVGRSAGAYNTIGSSNIYIGTWGPPSGTESYAIRIGQADTHTAAYLAGVYHSTAAGGLPVYVNSNGQLGTSASSQRFKEQVRDMGDSTSALMKLRPVTFLYKPEYDQGERTLQYGLIAEEVAKVYPELVAYDKDGQPYSVRYQYLTTMLLNELQKEHRKVEDLKAELQLQKAELRKQNDDLQQRLMRVETLLQSQVNRAIAHTASVVSSPSEGMQK